MRLYEEYAKRHDIKLRLVQHCREGVAFFYLENWPANYLILKIRTDKPSSAPPIYLVEFLVPIKNSLKYLDFLPGTTTVELEWDQYESYFHDWIDKSNGIIPVRSGKETALFLWEAFVHCEETWFAREFEHKNVLAASLIGPPESRYKNYKIAMAYLKSNYSHFYKSFLKEFPSLDNYCDWFHPLFEQKNENQSHR